MPLGDSARKIDEGLVRLRRTRTIDLLQPGKTAPDVRATLERLGLTCSDELVSLYEWHDGTDATSGAILDDLHLFPGFYLLTLADAAATYEAFEDDPRWDRSWFPILANGGGDFFTVVCDEFGGVVRFRIEDSEHPVEYSSISKLLETIAAAFENGVFYVDDRGYLEMHDDVFAALASRLDGDVDGCVGGDVD
jgi:cell wall assembly regulator SMI1